jgi:hypothetical protein
MSHPFRRAEDLINEFFGRSPLSPLFSRMRGTRIPIDEPNVSNQQFRVEEVNEEDELLKEAIRLSKLEEAKRRRDEELNSQHIDPMEVDLTKEDDEFEQALRLSALEQEKKQTVNKGHPEKSPIIEFPSDDEDEEYHEAIKRSLDEEEKRKRVDTPEARENRKRQMLREEQDHAFHESLRQDMEKERLQQEEIRKQELEYHKQQEEEAIKLSIELNRQKRCKDLEAQLPAEPPADAPNAVHLVLRTPSGERLERRFLGSNKLQILKDFIDSKSIDMNLPEHYEIVCPFPKKTFNNFDITFEEAGLVGRSLLAIQSL